MEYGAKCFTINKTCSVISYQEGRKLTKYTIDLTKSDQAYIDTIPKKFQDFYEMLEDKKTFIFF